MIDKFVDPIFTDWKNYLKKQNSIHFINCIFILGLLVLLFGPRDRNISIKVANFNIIKLAGNLQNILYSWRFFEWFILISILSVLTIMLLWDKTSVPRKLSKLELVNGKTFTYSGKMAVNRIVLMN